MSRIPTVAGCLVLALSLSACGGGGGGSAGAGSGVGSVQVGEPNCPHPGAGETDMDASEYALAGDVWCLTNDARAQKGLAPLTWDDPASQVAYLHSVWQRGQGGISHTGENGSSPGDRLQDGGVSWTAWAENVAVGQPTPTAVVNAWLNSSGHYANIMWDVVTHLGVGVEEGAGGPYAGPWWTQNFYAP